jgi:hypothetical protein
MLAKAPYRESLPERRPSRQSENSQTRARNEAVRRVLSDKRITDGCARFYCLIDQHYGRGRGLVYPKIETLVLRFGLHRKSCQRWIAQLREFGYLATEPRNGRACKHRLTWTQNVAPEAAPVSPLGPINASEEVIESTPAPSGGVREPRTTTDSSVSPQNAYSDTTSCDADPAGGAVHDCPHCQNAGWRLYVVPASRGAGGRLIPEARWRGKCGCRT